MGQTNSQYADSVRHEVLLGGFTPSRLNWQAICAGMFAALLYALVQYWLARVKAAKPHVAMSQASEIILIHRVTVMAAETDSVDEALQQCVDAVCKLAGWPLGHVYVPDDAKQKLISTDIWHLQRTELFEPFRELTQDTTFARGIGLPGRIWASKEPAWIENVTQDDTCPRANKCTDVDVRGAFGFPVSVGDEVVAVLEFYSNFRMELDETLLRTARIVGDQLGRMIERSRNEDINRGRRTDEQEHP